MSPIEQECLDSLIQEKIHIQQNLNEGLNYLYIKVLKESCVIQSYLTYIFLIIWP